MPVPVGSTIHTIGEIEGRTAKTFSAIRPVPSAAKNDRHLMMDLRSSYDVLPLGRVNVGGKAFQILNWGQEQPLLPHACGAYRTDFSNCKKNAPKRRQVKSIRISRHHCIDIAGKTAYWLSTPATSGELSTVCSRFRTGRNFWGSGNREVPEETGLHIKTQIFPGSQLWPYPAGIMIGFTAPIMKAETSNYNKKELVPALYTKDNLLEYPKTEHQWKLIDAWLEKSFIERDELHVKSINTYLSLQNLKM